MQKRTVLVSYEATYQVLLFLYFCGLNAHNKGTGFDALFCRAAFVALIGFELLCLIYFRKKAKLRKSFFMYLMLVVFYFISALWSKNMNDVFFVPIINGFIQVLGVLFVVDQHIETEEDIQTCLKLMCWSIAYMVLLLVVRTPISIWGSKRIGGAMGMNANDIGIKCTIGLLLSLYYSDRKKEYYILAMVFTLIALFTGSRKAFFMILIGFVLFFTGKDSGLKVLRNICLGFIAAALLLYAVFHNELLYNIIGYRIQRAIDYVLGIRTINAYGNFVEDFSMVERSFYRKHAMEMFLSSAGWGYGANGFVTEMRNIGYAHVAYSHCNYTELLATLGIIGFSIYYVPRATLLLKSGWQFIVSRERGYVLICAFLLTSLMAEFFFVSYYSVADQVVFALLALIPKMKSNEIEAENEFTQSNWCSS